MSIRQVVDKVANWDPWKISVGSMVFSGMMYYMFPLTAFHIPDASEYLRVGNHFFQTGNFDSDKMMPLYPIISALSVRLAWPPLVNILLSGLSCIVIYHLSLVFRLTRFVAVVAAISMALFPFPVFYAVSGLSETSFVFFVLLAFLLLYQDKTWSASFALVAAILIRPAFDLLNPILIVVVAYCVHAKSWKKILPDLGKYAVIYALIMAPWWYLNSQRYGQFVRLNLGSGEMFYGGNSQFNKTGRSNPDELNFSEFKSISNPVERNDLMLLRAREEMLADLPLFLKKCLKRFLAFWNILPNHDDFRTPLISPVIALVSLYLMLGTALFFFRSGFDIRSYYPVLLCFLYLTVVHTVTIGSIRYRYPLEPFMMIFAASAFSSFLKSSQSRSS